MNKLEANLSLFAITFLAAIQYAFLTGVPDDTSQFLFLSLTNLIGFIFAIALFFNELFRINKVLILKSMLLAGELLGFNAFLLLGSTGTDPTVISCVLSAYFLFIIPIMKFFFKKKTPLSSLLGVTVVIIGLLLIFEANLKAFWNLNVLYLIIADIFFAAYVITVEMFAAKENPSMLATGQMFWGFLFSTVAFAIECFVGGGFSGIPIQSAFWGSVIFMGVFIRGIYGIVQIYAQRYITAFNTSLIFSTEIIMTMLMSPVIYIVFGITSDPITPIRIVGGLIMVLGILLADESFIGGIKRRLQKNEKKKS